MNKFSRDTLQAFDTALADSAAGFDYYPDQRALSAYAQATRTHLPLTGTAYFVFKDSDRYVKQYKHLSGAERCSIIIDEWNESHPDQQIENPFTD